MITVHISDDTLDVQESRIRDEMIYMWNPTLKYLLSTYSNGVWEKFAFNSCRQTAILGAFYLNEHFKRYRWRAFEGNFSDIENNQKGEYLHAFIVGYNNDQKILVDISRTTRKLIFSHIDFDTDIIKDYPKYPGYQNCKLLAITEEYNINNLVNTNIKEYVTGMYPFEIHEYLVRAVHFLYITGLYKEVSDRMYSQFTQIPL